MHNLKPERMKPNKNHRKFVASLSCCACRMGNRSQAAHIRAGSNAGMSRKPTDDLCVPLCATYPDRLGCHDIQGKDERGFWEKYGGIEKAKELAVLLYANTGNWEKCCDLLIKFRRRS